MKALLSVGALLVLACGGQVASSPDAGSQADSASGDALQDGGYCISPSGIEICGGRNNCGTDCPKCAGALDPSALRVCEGRSGILNGSDQCTDGFLFAPRETSLWRPGGLGGCANAELAHLYALNGYPEFCNYADRMIYTDAPIPPTPTSCPALGSGLKLCGGACGSCGPKQVCLGRSPKHPYSLCADQLGNQASDARECQRGTGGFCGQTGPRECMTFLVDPQSQAIADQYSMCVAISICEAAQKDYPGGVVCTPGML